MRPCRAMVLAALFAVGCEFSEKHGDPAPSSQRMYGTVHIFSEPPGAHVYCGGEYWGETSATQPVARVFWNDGNRAWTNLTLKKRGYKPTNYNMVVRLEYSSQAESELHPSKVVIVMDTE